MQLDLFPNHLNWSRLFLIVLRSKFIMSNKFSFFCKFGTWSSTCTHVQTEKKQILLWATLGPMKKDGPNGNPHEPAHTTRIAHSFPIGIPFARLPSSGVPNKSHFTYSSVSVINSLFWPLFFSRVEGSIYRCLGMRWVYKRNRPKS